MTRYSLCSLTDYFTSLFSYENTVVSVDTLMDIVAYNVLVNSCGHIGTVTSDFMGLLPDIELNDTSSPATKHRPTELKTKTYMQGLSIIELILGRLRPSKRLTRTQVLSQLAALRGSIL